MYGTNGHEEPPEGLVIENYTMRGPDDHPDNTWVKAIVNPRRTEERVDGPHAFYYYGTPVGEDHRPNPTHRREPPTAELLRINHYFSRSAREYAQKRARPNVADGKVRDTAQLPPDAVPDETILQFVPALRREFRI
jgi:hypothetical protein